jgi:hypothetical protein
MERTELIEKLKKVSTGLGRLGQIAEQNTINEAIALLEKPRVSAEEVIKKRYPFYNPDRAQKDIEINAEQAIELMHDYAGQSDAMEFAEWISKNCNMTVDLRHPFSVNNQAYTTEELYQAFLNREEKQK